MVKLSRFQRKAHRIFSTTSLKRKLIHVLLLSTFIPLLLIGIISYTSMHKILETKITSGIHSNLRQVRVSLENVLGNLNYASQQLAFDGRVGKDIYAYMTNDHPYDRRILADKIETEMNLLTSTNPNIGLMFYYDQHTNRIMFPNQQVSDGFNPDALPVFTKLKSMTYFGPHQSLNAQFDRKVMSITRKIDFPDLDQLYIYMETDNRLVDTVFNKLQYGMLVYHLVIDTDNGIAYSESPSNFPVGMKLTEPDPTDGRMVFSSHYVFEEASNQGWRVVAVIPMRSYKHEIFTWFMQLAAVVSLALFVSIGFAWLIWRTVTRPLTRLNYEIRSMTYGRSQSEIQLTGTDEFDYSLRQFQKMKTTIIQLIDEIKENERNRSRLEVEKMISQINPHFIHNTLDTIRWQARLNGQQDIDHLISTLNRVFHYNLGKGETASIREELRALKDYIALQEVRYQFHFDIRIAVEPEQLELSIPRFMLQPLVENALYHGIADDGSIWVDICQSEGCIRIEVCDNGGGMSPEEADRLLKGEHVDHKRRGMGIGMPYVIRTLKYQYGDSAGIQIRSQSGEGTSIIITIPLSLSGKGEGQSCAY